MKTPGTMGSGLLGLKIEEETRNNLYIYPRCHLEEKARRVEPTKQEKIMVRSSFPTLHSREFYRTVERRS